MATYPVPAVGAPVLEAYSPRPGTAAARFQQWLVSRRPRVQHMLERLTARWQPLGAFVEVNFVHPHFGPAGALILTDTTIDPEPLRRRAERLRVIPLRELAEYVPEWKGGNTVLVSVDDMPDDLARRYATTPIRWSLNVPIRVEGTWVGLVGAVAGEEGFVSRAMDAFEAFALVLMHEFAADRALCSFRRSTGNGRHLVRVYGESY